MKCPECGYISFDHLKRCKKCGYRLSRNTGQDPPFTRDLYPPLDKASYQFSYPGKQDKDPMQGSNMDVSLSPRDSNKSVKNALGASAFLAGSMEDDEVFMEEAFQPQESGDDPGAKRIQTTGDQSLAGFWIRSLAMTIDIILISLIQIIFAWVIKIGIITGAGILDVHARTFFDLREFLITIMGASIFAFYFIFFHASSGQTPGKKLLHLKVVGTDHKPIDMKKSVNRFLGYIVSALPLYFGFIMVAFNRKKQGLHDIIARTQVIKTD